MLRSRAGADGHIPGRGRGSRDLRVVSGAVIEFARFAVLVLLGRLALGRVVILAHGRGGTCRSVEEGGPSGCVHEAFIRRASKAGDRRFERIPSLGVIVMEKGDGGLFSVRLGRHG